MNALLKPPSGVDTVRCFVSVKRPCVSQRGRSLVSRIPLDHSRRRYCRIVRSQDESGGEKGGASGKSDAKTEEMVKGMKTAGIDQATAKKIMEVWEKTGIEDVSSLRKLLLKRSLTSAGVVGFQTLLDAGAAYGAFSWGTFLQLTQDQFFGKWALVALAYFLAGYFTIGVFMDMFMLGVISFAAIQYGTNTPAFMAAIRELAGTPSGVSVVDKAQFAVNTIKVITALNDISDLLKRGVGLKDDKPSTLKNLSAMLTLSKAEQKGFKPEDFGLSADDAGSIASVFSRFDANDDMVLQEDEVRRLFVEEGYNLDDAEVKAAIKILDKDGDGLINFPEFVDWWVNKIKPDVAAAK